MAEIKSQGPALAQPRGEASKCEHKWLRRVAAATRERNRGKQWRERELKTNGERAQRGGDLQQAASNL